MHYFITYPRRYPLKLGFFEIIFINIPLIRPWQPKRRPWPDGLVTQRFEMESKVFLVIDIIAPGYVAGRHLK